MTKIFEFMNFAKKVKLLLLQIKNEKQTLNLNYLQSLIQT